MVEVRISVTRNNNNNSHRRGKSRERVLVWGYIGRKEYLFMGGGGDSERTE